MTLIGGLRAKGVPLLFGDFLLSSASGERKGFRKKVVRLADNCAMAWAGDELVAWEVFRDVSERLTEPVISRSKLEELLTGYPDGYFASLSAHFIGWIIDVSTTCFLWNSDYPSELFPHTNPVFAGSGARWMEQNHGIGHLGEHPHDFPNLDVITHIFRLYSFLMHNEIDKGTTHSSTYIYAYKFLLCKEGSFKYISDIIFMSIEIEIDEQNSYINQTFINPWRRYSALDSYSEILSVNNSTNRAKYIAVLSPGIKRPAGIDSRKREVESRRPDIKANYYSISYTYKSKTLTYPRLVNFVPNGNTGLHIINMKHKDLI